MVAPIEHAYNSLLGLWVGDAFGGNFEFESVDWHRPRRAFEKRDLPAGKWRYTDDTQMALSIYETLRNCNEIPADKLADSFVHRFDISRGYGIGTEELLLNMKNGGDWSILSPARYNGQGSNGNGSAMRVAPIGAYFADDFDRVIENAKQSSIVTHTHPDAVAGTLAVALASAKMASFAINQSIPNTTKYWHTLLEHTPEGALHDKLKQASQLPTHLSHFDVAKQLGSGWDVTALDTVPFTLWCAIRYHGNLEEALWHTISVGGDTDTTGAIVGGLITSYGGQTVIPENLMQNCEPLPKWI